MNILELNILQNQQPSQGVSRSLSSPEQVALELREEFTAILDKIARTLRTQGVSTETLFDAAQLAAHEARRAGPSRPRLQDSHEAIEARPEAEGGARPQESDGVVPSAGAERTSGEQTPTDEAPTAASADGADVARAAAATVSKPSVVEPQPRASLPAAPTGAEQESVSEESVGPSDDAAVTGESTSPLSHKSVDPRQQRVEAKQQSEPGVSARDPQSANGQQPEVGAAVSDEDSQTRDAELFLAALRDRSRASENLDPQRHMPRDLGMHTRMLDAQARMVAPLLQMGVLKQALEVVSQQRAAGSVSASQQGAAVTPQPSSIGTSQRQERFDQAPAGRQVSRPQMLRAFERVENALKEVAHSKNGKSIQVSLEPDQLGKVRVSVTLRDSVLHARVVPESPAMIESLREHSHELQAMLRRLGLDVDRIEVSIGGEVLESAADQSGMHGGSWSDVQRELTRESFGQADSVATQKVSSENERSEIVETRPSDDGHWVA